MSERIGVVIPDYIMSFITEIAPGKEELYLCFFNEKTVIKDATKVIKTLKAENQRMREAIKTALELFRAWGDSQALEILDKSLKEVDDE